MSTVIVIDDLRSFIDKRVCTYARTSSEGFEELERACKRDEVISELWLDHDLGINDDIMPIVKHLVQRAVEDDPVPVEMIYVHTANASAAFAMENQLRAYYATERVSADKHGLFWIR